MESIIEKENTIDSHSTYRILKIKNHVFLYRNPNEFRYALFHLLVY